MADTDPALKAELQTLRETVESLREELRALRDSVSDAQGAINLSMRSQTRCPACGCVKLLHAPEVLDRGESNSRNRMSLDKKGVIFTKPVGAFEVYACTNCGLVEWYTEVGGIKPDGKRILLVVGDESKSTGPYR